ncbi:MAG TPA: carboxypeptidase-like regulatory domain-containing protein, partial [Terriglobales bacterium]
MTVPRSQSLVKRRLLKSLVLLGWVMPLCGFLWASGPSDPQMYSINLSVIDEKNQPVPDATVAVRSTGGFISTAMTGATGKVTLAVNTAGSYSLSIQKKGYLPTETTLEVSESNTTQEVDVVLSEAGLSQQTVEVKGEASNPVTETASSQATLPTAQAKN